MRTLLTAAALAAFLATPALADEPVRLTDAQLDTVAGGFQFGSATVFWFGIAPTISGNLLPGGQLTEASQTFSFSGSGDVFSPSFGLVIVQ